MHSSDRMLPGTAWLTHIPQAWKMVLAAALASLAPAIVAYSALSGQPANTFELILSIGALLLSCVLLISAYRASTNLCCQVKKAYTRLQGGDFAARMVTAGTEDAQQLAQGFNDMAREVGRIVLEIRDAAAEVAYAAVEMKDGADKVAEAAQQQEESAVETAASVEEMTASIGEVATQSLGAEQTSRAVSDLSSTGSHSISQSSSQIASLAETTNDVSQLMNRLVQHSDEVTKATGMIKDISDQTNLLALNAAIEAARAGESGRGFAVVADEVRKLAQRARDSANEISDTATAIRSDIQHAVDDIATVNDQANESVVHAKGVADVLAKIDAQAKDALDSVHQIAAGAQQQSVASATIAEHVELIAQGAQVNTQSAAESADMARHLSLLADGMRSALASLRG